MAFARAQLVDVSLNRGEADQRFFLYKFPFRVGRQSHRAKRHTGSNLEALPDNDLRIRDPGPVMHVSREHFEIDLQDGEFLVADRGSALGTIVNGQRVGGGRRTGRVKLDREENLILVGGVNSPFRFKLLLYPLKARILVADDDPKTVKMLADFLQAQGHDVISADTGIEAVRRIVVERPDLMLLDWMMPAINGVEICRQVKSNPVTSHIPIIIVTAKIASEDKVAGFEAGADEFLTKPFDIHDLDMRVKRLLSRSIRGRTVHPQSGLPNENAFREEADTRLQDEEAAENVSVLLIRLEGLGSYQAEHGQAEARCLVDEVWRFVGAMPTQVGASGAVVGHLSDNTLAILTSPEWALKLEALVRSDLAPKYPAVAFDVSAKHNKDRECQNLWQMLEHDGARA